LQGKSVFGVNLGVNWKKLKYEDLIDFLGGLIGRIRDLSIRILKFYLFDVANFKINFYGKNL
jgi:hypothetical protein